MDRLVGTSRELWSPAHVADVPTWRRQEGSRDLPPPVGRTGGLRATAGRIRERQATDVVPNVPSSARAVAESRTPLARRSWGLWARDSVPKLPRSSVVPRVDCNCLDSETPSRGQGQRDGPRARLV